jgi:hypothetical protein
MGHCSIHLAFEGFFQIPSLSSVSACERMRGSIRPDGTTVNSAQFFNQRKRVDVMVRAANGGKAPGTSRSIKNAKPSSRWRAHWSGRSDAFDLENRVFEQKDFQAHRRLTQTLG